jgi:hypothetical protein
MPVPISNTIAGTDLQRVLDAMEKQRKEMAWLLESLDSANIKELSASKLIDLEVLGFASTTDLEAFPTTTQQLEFQLDEANNRLWVTSGGYSAYITLTV